MKWKLVFLQLLILLFLSRESFSSEFQLWTELKYIHPFKDSRFSLVWAIEDRFRRKEIDLFFFNTTLGFQYQAYHWLSTGFAYRYQTAERNEEDDFSDEQRLMPQAELKTTLGKLELQNRNIFEVRILPHQVSDSIRFRYRSRIRLSKKIPFQKWSVTPYASEEIFIEPQTNNFNQNRMIVGNSFGFLKDKVSFDLYYIYRTDLIPENGGVLRIQGVGTSLGFRY